jgi:hypothetical protein
MEIKYGVTGKDRKELVTAIAEITGADAIYKGVPTCNYEVDYFTVDKAGTLFFNDSADSEEVEQEVGHLLEELAKRGFVGQQGRTEEPEQGFDGLAVSLPIDKVNVYNLENLLESKKTLICKALGIGSLPVDAEENRVAFPWFRELPDADRVKAYTHFIAALCEMSVTQKRISATEKLAENEKYAFRCFLLRLEFIGAEYKDERKILLENLSGSSAFKSGKAGDEE